MIDFDGQNDNLSDSDDDQESKSSLSAISQENFPLITFDQSIQSFIVT